MVNVPEKQTPEEGQVNCPSCGEVLTNVYAARSVELQKEGDIWIEKNVFSGGASCPHCHEDLDMETCEKLGIPSEWY